MNKTPSPVKISGFSTTDTSEYKSSLVFIHSQNLTSEDPSGQPTFEMSQDMTNSQDLLSSNPLIHPIFEVDQEIIDRLKSDSKSVIEKENVYFPRSIEELEKMKK